MESLSHCPNMSDQSLKLNINYKAYIQVHVFSFNSITLKVCRFIIHCIEGNILAIPQPRRHVPLAVGAYIQAGGANLPPLFSAL